MSGFKKGDAVRHIGSYQEIIVRSVSASGEYFDAEGDRSPLTRLVCHYNLIGRSPPPAPSFAPTIKTKRTVVPGEYGIVDVGSLGEINIVSGCYTAEALREAAHILNQIAEVMEDGQ